MRLLPLHALLLVLLASTSASEALSLREMWKIMITSDPEMLASRLKRLLEKIQGGREAATTMGFVGCSLFILLQKSIPVY